MLTLAFLFTALSLFESILSWISGLAIIACLMRLALIFHWQKQTVSIRTLNLLAVLSALTLAWFGWQLGLLLAMTNLLVLAISLKLMLLRNQKDYFQLIIVVLFLIGCGFIFYQNIGFTLFYLIQTLIIVISLACYFSPTLPLKQQMGTVIKMSLQALPIALVLFLLLPQIGPLWQMPNLNGAKTGLSDKVNPGDLSHIAQSGDLAFRASFEQSIPPVEQRYWRTIVMEQFDGHSWQVAPQRIKQQERLRRANQSFQPVTTGPSYKYSVIAEPTFQRWLYALDVGQSHDRRVWQSPDYQLLSKQPVQNKMQYEVQSWYQMPLDQGRLTFDLQLNLQLPDSGNPRTIDWVKQLRQQYGQDQAFIDAVLRYFKQQSFRYTLRPELMPENMVDRFLFDYRAGFCAHYASAMAYILRLANIPARMVTGYLGGEVHEGNYLSIYQYDAHAWVEAWQEDQGWVRYDPTAVVSPERLLYGLEQAVAYENTFLTEQGFSLAKMKSIQWLNNIRLTLAEMDYLWSRWVLGFNQQRQQDMLKQLLGNLQPGRIAIFTFLSLLGLAGLIALYHWKSWLPSRGEPVLRLYHQAIKLLAQRQILRHPGQGPNDFKQQVQQTHPADIAEPFAQITEHFIQYQYAQLNSSNNQDLRKQLSKLKKALKQTKV